MGSKMIRIGKTIDLFLLIIFTLQVTGITCVCEDSFSTLVVQGELQLQKADLDDGSNAYSHVGYS